MTQTDPFLPDDYEIPASISNYMKLEDGTNRFRILSPAIIGWEYWTEDAEGRHPIRVKDKGTATPPNGETLKHFWAFKVWNYQTQSLQVLELTQKTLHIAIKGFAADPDWGSPLGYDIVITKEGEKLKTKYSVIPKPAKPLAKEIKDELTDWVCNLDALFSGDDPFELPDSDKDLPF